MRLVRLAHRFLVRQAMPGFVARYYERLIDSISDVYLQPLCDEIAAALPGPAVIADVGTGTGQLPVLLARAMPAAQIVGVDLSAPFLRIAEAKARAAGVSDRVRFVRGDMTRLPGGTAAPADPGANRLADGSVDLAVSTCSMHHWRSPCGVLRAMARILRPGGSIWILDDWGEAPPKAKSDWVETVERLARPGPLFRWTFRFESRFLAYTRREVEALGERAGLALSDFSPRGPFFLARMRARTQDRGRSEPGAAAFRL